MLDSCFGYSQLSIYFNCALQGNMNNSNEITTEQQLTRLVLANMLFQDQFYVDGKTTVDIIANEVAKADKEFVSKLAITARTKYKLRHIPLLLTRELAKLGGLTATTLAAVIQRPDEMSKFLELYFESGKQPLSNQVKRGLGQAFKKFSEFQLAKWDKHTAKFSVKDIMFLTHPKPDTAVQELLFKQVATEKLKTPYTWETELSAGGNKRETFTTLMLERKLGALAFLRNLRNMVKSGVSEELIRRYATQVDCERVLPFRYIAAATEVPEFEDMLEQMMFKSLQQHKKLQGRTLLLVDVSGSMFGMPISKKSDLDRFDAAAALAILCREVCEQVSVYTFSDSAVKVSDTRGFALRKTLSCSQEHMGTSLQFSLNQIKEPYTRIIVFTDEQSEDSLISEPKHGAGGYIINVAAYKQGVDHDAWHTISGFSESVIDYIQASEELESSSR